MSEYKFDLIAAGSPIMDSLINVSEEFVAGIDGGKGGMELVDSAYIENLIAKAGVTVTSAPGGSAANSIFAASNLGLKTAIIGKVGNDDVSVDYQEQYLDINGSTELFKRSNSPHGHCLSLITPDKQRTMRTSLGAAMELSIDDVSVADFENVKVAHLEGYMLYNRDLIFHVLECAKQAGCIISLDLSAHEVVNASADVLKEIIEKYVDVVFANEDEAAAFTGIESDYEAMAKYLSKLCEVAVVKMGADGCFVADENSITKVDAFEVETVVDTTGAGDAFAGGFLYGLIQGWSLDHSAVLASLLGAEVVQVIGAKIPEESWVSIKEFIKESIK